MRVVMAVAHPYLEAIEALYRAAPEAEMVNVSEDPYAYWALVSRLWHTGDPFVLVEHDIVLRPDTIERLSDCVHQWCAFTYLQAPGEPVSGLGCVKFIPTVPLHLEAGWGDPIWQNVDATVAGLLHAAGWRVHEHKPPLRHLNPKVIALQEGENNV